MVTIRKERISDGSGLRSKMKFCAQVWPRRFDRGLYPALEKLSVGFGSDATGTSEISVAAEVAAW